MIFAISPWFALCLGASAKPKSDGQPHRGGAGGGSHGSGAEALRSRTPTPPISIARWDSSNLARATRPDHFRQSRPDDPCPETPPFLLKGRVPGRKICDRGLCYDL